MKDVYQRLAEFLDSLPQRYPVNTGTGIELKILKHIFTPEEAEMTMQLTSHPVSAGELAARIGMDPDTAERKLYEMSRKGQIFRSGRVGAYRYTAIGFVIGFMELQMNRLTPELLRDMKKFEQVLFEATWMKGDTRDLRTIPVCESLAPGTQFMPYESAEETIRSSKHIAVSECMCRKMTRMLDEPCNRPSEVCFHFGSTTHFFVENGLARFVSEEEAMAIFRRGIDAALVCQVTSAQEPNSMCMCCACCCVPLKMYRKMEKPAELANSNFFATVDERQCTDCGACVERCQMDALSADDTARVNLDRCIGCGLCAIACPEGAIKVLRKDRKREFIPEKDFRGWLNTISEERRRVR